MARMRIHRGMGRLFRRSAQGRWGFKYEGERVMTPYTDKRAAEAWRRKYLAEVATGTRQVGAENATVNDLLDLLVRDYERKQRASLQSEASYIRRLRERLGTVRLQDWRDGILDDYADARAVEGRWLKSGRRKPVAPATINRELELLRRAWYLGHKQTPPLVAHVPRFPMLPVDNVRTQTVDHETYKRLCDALPDAERWLVVLAYHTGWRKARLLGLTWDQVDFEAGVIRPPTRQASNKRVGAVPIYGEMQGVLSEALRSAESIEFEHAREAGIQIANPRPTPKRITVRAGYVRGLERADPGNVAKPERGSGPDRPAHPRVLVIHRPNGRPVVDIKRQWERATRAAGCPDLRLHDLRACAASTMHDAGIPIHEVMRMLGHKTMSMALRYDIVSDKRLRGFGERLEEHRGTDEAAPARN